MSLFFCLSCSLSICPVCAFNSESENVRYREMTCIVVQFSHSIISHIVRHLIHYFFSVCPVWKQDNQFVINWSIRLRIIILFPQNLQYLLEAHVWVRIIELWTISSTDPFTKPYLVSRHLILSHAKAWHVYDSKYRATQNGKVSLAINSDWAHGGQDPKDLRAAELYLQVCIRVN